MTCLQITPQNRSDIPEYIGVGAGVSSLAGRINGKYGEVSWTPIRYVNRVYSRSALAGLYRSARVGLVTPLRDGMNLVAKEYIAAQDPDDPGVLILSRFAGAAVECKRALLVNPYDVESVAAAVAQALTMSRDERRERHAALMAAITDYSIDKWQKDFLAALRSENRGAEEIRAAMQTPTLDRSGNRAEPDNFRGSTAGAGIVIVGSGETGAVSVCPAPAVVNS